MKQLLLFIVLSAFLCWFMFSPAYKHILIMRQALLQKEVDYLLEIGANGAHGYIDEAMIEQSRQRLSARGFEPSALVYEISAAAGGSGTDPYRPVPRGSGLSLKLTYPYQQLFLIDRLIGISVPAPAERMGAFGLKMSEFVP